MKSICKPILIAVQAIWLMPSLLAQEHQHTQPSSLQDLGTVSFPTSCKASVQAPFERGIALLHSFGYDVARKQFEAVAAADPDCAMAYWGQAMTLFHELWDRPSKEDYAEGSSLIRKAQAIGAKTERERSYIEAGAAFYLQGDKATYEARTTAYSQALQKLRDRSPHDDEATTFYALSLLASPDANKDDLAYRKKAVVLLNDVLSRQPNHPGVAHYVIHACDNPEMANQGLSAARRYAKIAPASAHAVHMPSHVFTRLGLWQDDIKSNLASKKVAEEQHETESRLHAMAFLEYAYLQVGALADAQAISAEALLTKRGDYHRPGDYYIYVQSHFPATYALETKDWKELSSLPVPANDKPFFQAVVYSHRAIAAGHLRDVKAATEAMRNCDLALDKIRQSSDAYLVNGMKAGHDEAQAWSWFAQRDAGKAIKLLSSVANEQDKAGKAEVEIPAREMLADMLVELNRPEEALAQYEQCLKTDPNRFNSLCGAAHAAESSHQSDKARAYYIELLKGREEGLGPRHPELLHARAYLSGSHS